MSYSFIKEKLGHVLLTFYRYRLPEQMFCCQVNCPETLEPNRVVNTILESYDMPRSFAGISKRRANQQAIILPLVWGEQVFITANIHAQRFIDDRTKKGDLIDLRVEPIFIEHYSVGIRNNQACVRIAGKHFNPRANKLLGMWMIDLDQLQFYFDKITPFTQIATVNEQLEHLRTRINRKRKNKKMTLLQPASWKRFKGSMEKNKGGDPAEKTNLEL